MFRNSIAAVLLSSLIATTAQGVAAQDVRITTFKTNSTYSLNGADITVTRTQDLNATLPPQFARTARACPPDCIQPMRAADGVETFGELELLDFFENRVTDGTGLVLDVRDTDAFAAGAIPGAINVPVATLVPENHFRNGIFRDLGAVDTNSETRDFSGAMALTLYSGGVWSDTAPTAIDNLLEAGYPPEKLFYFRGGMQAWQHVGLTVQ